MKNKLQSRTFEGMKYRKVQRKNKRNRNLLKTENQQWLKDNNFKNSGWQNIIDLYCKIVELQRQEEIGEMDLENLFLEADRIGNKYFTPQELQAKQQAISKELNEIANILDKQYPAREIEVVDYSKTNRKRKRTRR